MVNQLLNLRPGHPIASLLTECHRPRDPVEFHVLQLVLYDVRHSLVVVVVGVEALAHAFQHSGGRVQGKCDRPDGVVGQGSLEKTFCGLALIR